MTNAELRQLDAEADSHQADADAHRARLAVASARSYARNTRDPLAAAEGDLLGEALGVLREVEMTHIPGDVSTGVVLLPITCLSRMRDLLARAKEARP